MHHAARNTEHGTLPVSRSTETSACQTSRMRPFVVFQPFVLEFDSASGSNCRPVRNSVIVILLAALLFGTANLSQAAARHIARPRYSAGRDYVSLREWARANNFSIRYQDRDKTLQLSNREAELVFNLDPHSDGRRAAINGVEVWLAFPILPQGGAVLISETDLAQTIGPVLHPPSNPAGIKVRTICIDPGHGGKDPGFRVGGNEEQKYTLLLAQELRDQLKAAGFNVVLTRTSDAYIPLESRTDIARQRKADLFVSLHFNAVETQRTEVKGAQTYCCTPAGATSSNAGGEGDTRWVEGNRTDEKNMLLAYQVQRSLARNLGVEDRGVKRARFQVLRESTMPAILIEGGFMSNPAEGRRIYDPAYRKQMARAIVQGILGYQRNVRG